MDVLDTQRVALTEQEELRREATKRKMIDEAITAASRRTTHNTKEVVENLHCEDLTKDWVAYLFNGMIGADAYADVRRVREAGSR
jgi:ribosomal protein L17